MTSSSTAAASVNGDATSPTCLFIGAGQMASALIGGLLSSSMLTVDRLVIVDPNPARRSAAKASFNITTFASIDDIPNAIDIVFICVKPDVVSRIVQGLPSSPRLASSLIVSIAAGVSIASIEQHLTSSARVVRVMPNTPCLVGMAAAGISGGSAATPSDLAQVQRLMGAVGEAIVVPESKLDAVTGVSGSGPAYVFTMIQAMADGGVAAGLKRDQAQLLAAQTVMGAARMVLQTGKHPGQLKDEVASPGGTTIAGLVALEQKGFRGVVIDAVLAAANRGKQLSRENN